MTMKQYRLNLFEHQEKSHLPKIEEAIRFLSEVKEEIGTLQDISALKTIHDLAVKIQGHALELRLNAARELGKISLTERR